MARIDHIWANRSTVAQRDYVEILAIDLGIGTRRQRNAHISEIVGRSIKFVDELSSVEAGLVITQFKRWKKDASEMPSYNGEDIESIEEK
jgi:hypothetical protein